MNKTRIFLMVAVGLAVLAAVIGLPSLRPASTVPIPVPVVDVRTVPASPSGALNAVGRLSHPYIGTGATDVFLTVDVTGAEVPGAERTPVNLAVVIDRSGSMAGQKLEQAKAAASHLVRQLKERDRLAIIHYGSEVRSLESLAATEANQSRMLQFIAQIRDDGGTNIGEALAAAQRALAPAHEQYKVNRVILITDGQPTEGMTDARGLVSEVKQIHGGRINVSAIGVGADFNENLLQQFAEYGAGSYGYLEDTSQLASLFQKDLEQATTTVARNVALDVELPPGVTLREVLGRRFAQDGRTVHVPLTDFSAGQTERVVARLTVQGEHAGEIVDVARTRVAYQDLMGNADRVVNGRVTATVTDRREEVAARRDKDATVIATRAVAAMNLERAADALTQGEPAKARDLLEENRGIFADAEKVAGHGALARDESELAPAPAAFAATAPAEVSGVAKKAKVHALKGEGRLGSVY